MNTHGNVVFNAAGLRDWVGLSRETWCSASRRCSTSPASSRHIAVALLVGPPMVLVYRFDPTVDHRRRSETTPGHVHRGGDHRVHRADERSGRGAGVDLSSLDQGVHRWRADPADHGGRVPAHGRAVHPQRLRADRDHLAVARRCRSDRRAPVDQARGALSVGVPIYDTIVQIVDDEGNDLPVGEIGELVTTGPQVVAGYWNKPEEPAKALPGGSLHTGDVGYMDAEGWFYIVDRKKDQINAGGYKVWPREVEDVLYEHEPSARPPSSACPMSTAARR